jgi:NTP pyrophosphatase (non-canonical NTP hydrolase)
MDDFKEIINVLKSFRDERDWEQFHNPKDLAIALSIESNELLEQFLWKKPEDANRDKLKEELADVFAYAFLLADKLELDIKKIVLDKVKLNAEKYPVAKAKGTAKKYNEL